MKQKSYLKKLLGDAMWSTRLQFIHILLASFTFNRLLICFSLSEMYIIACYIIFSLCNCSWREKNEEKQKRESTTKNNKYTNETFKNGHNLSVAFFFSFFPQFSTTITSWNWRKGVKFRCNDKYMVNYVAGTTIMTHKS